MKKTVTGQTPVIGWREWVQLPDLGIDAVKVKVDTGARSSALHAFDLKTTSRAEGEVVRFKVHPRQRDSKFTVECEARILEYRQVRSSSGKATVRPVILTDVILMGERYPIELTLTSRDEMGFRMLLGREAVRGRFLVDPGRSFLKSDQQPVAKAPPGRRKSTRKKRPADTGE